MATILYFASLRETLDSDGEQLVLTPEVRCIGDLKQQLAQRGGVWQQAFTDALSSVIEDDKFNIEYGGSPLKMNMPRKAGRFGSRNRGRPGTLYNR